MIHKKNWHSKLNCATCENLGFFIKKIADIRSYLTTYLLLVTYWPSHMFFGPESVWTCVSFSREKAYSTTCPLHTAPLCLHKEMFDITGPNILAVINHWFDTGSVPVDIKQAVVQPLHCTRIVLKKVPQCRYFNFKVPYLNNWTITDYIFNTLCQIVSINKFECYKITI